MLAAVLVPDTKFCYFNAHGCILPQVDAECKRVVLLRTAFHPPPEGRGFLGRRPTIFHVVTLSPHKTISPTDLAERINVVPELILKFFREGIVPSEYYTDSAGRHRVVLDRPDIIDYFRELVRKRNESELFGRLDSINNLDQLRILELREKVKTSMIKNNREASLIVPKAQHLREMRDLGVRVATFLDALPSRIALDVGSPEHENKIKVSVANAVAEFKNELSENGTGGL